MFPGSEVFLLDGLQEGRGGLHLGHLQRQRRGHPQRLRQLEGPDADKLQAGITALRKAIQAFPMIPALKALIAHYRQDPGWAKLRPPFIGAARRRGRQG